MIQRGNAAGKLYQQTAQCRVTMNLLICQKCKSEKLNKIVFFWAKGFVALEINGLATDGPGLKNHPSAQGTWVQSPVGELGSHMPRAAKPEPHNY